MCIVHVDVAMTINLKTHCAALVRPSVSVSFLYANKTTSYMYTCISVASLAAQNLNVALPGLSLIFNSVTIKLCMHFITVRKIAVLGNVFFFLKKRQTREM